LFTVVICNVLLQNSRFQLLL